MSRQGRYPWFGVPPARRPRPAALEPALTGKRVILSTPEGFIYDMRAVSERYVDDRLRDCVDVATEHAYYNSLSIKRPPHVERWPTHLLWVDGN